MTSSNFCPVCQRKNSSDSKRCAYCGSALQMDISGLGVRTTLNIAPSLDNLQVSTVCQEYLKQISVGDICLFFEKKQTPVILHNISEMILGRFFDDSESNNLDLDPYGGSAYGVSRRHARIIQVDGKFVLEDLNSTNGSWLNGQRIPSGTTYPLMSGDQIWLGQFKMQVCFHQEKRISSTTLLLRDTTTFSKNLNPTNLLTGFGPYLKDIADLQAVAAECLNLESENVTIEKIDASGPEAYIMVHIVNNPEAIHLIRKWIMPWRLEQQIEEKTIKDPDKLNEALVQLSSRLITDIAPDLSDEARFSIIEKTLPIVKNLATGPIELSFEAL